MCKASQWYTVTYIVHYLESLQVNEGSSLEAYRVYLRNAYVVTIRLSVLAVVARNRRNLIVLYLFIYLFIFCVRLNDGTRKKLFFE